MSHLGVVWVLCQRNLLHPKIFGATGGPRLTALNSNKRKTIVVLLWCNMVQRLSCVLVLHALARLQHGRFPREAQDVTTAEAAAAFGYVSSPSLAKQINRLQGHVGGGFKTTCIFGKNFPTPVYYAHFE